MSDVRFAEQLIVHERRAYALAMRLMRHPEDARDAVHDAYCKAILAEKTYDAARPLGPWFLSIVRNAALDRLRRTQAHVQIEEQIGGDLTSDGVLAREEAAAVHDALNRISTRYRRALELRYFEGYRYREIAAELCVKMATAQTLVHRARFAFRAAFSMR
jgi:RNA polymerase sigma-70 factor, ECF subfamily